MFGDARVRWDAGSSDLFLPAAGQLLDISQNQAMFAQLGTTYGGDGETNFGLPDLRGRTASHIGGTQPNLGAQFGHETHTLTVAEMTSHTHSLPSEFHSITFDRNTSSTGGGQPHNNLQPGLNMRYMIATDGIFPSRFGGGGQGDSVTNPYIGEVALTAGSFPLESGRGWAYAEGQILRIQDHSALFSILGARYGGDGEQTFALPDLRGRTPIGAGVGIGVDAIALGQMSGEAAVTLFAGSPGQLHQLPEHAHEFGTGETGNEGLGESHANMEPTLGLNHIIALNGFFPSPDSPAPLETFIGEVKLFAGDFAPEGYALAHGQLLEISQNSALFSLLGTTYGGDGQDNFRLPDLRGRVLIGEGTGNGLTSRVRGEYGGSNLAALALAQLPEHTHSFELRDDESNRDDAIKLVTGSPVSITQQVDTPAAAFNLDFEYQFETATGTLSVLLDGTEIGMFNAPAVLDGTFISESILIDGALLNLTGVDLTFLFDGPTGSVVLIDNIEFPGIVNGNFNDGTLDPWQVAASPNATATLVPRSDVPEPTTAVLGLIGIAGLARRRRKAA